MTLGQYYESIEQSPEWTFIQGKVNKMLPPAVKEKFGQCLTHVIGEAYHAGVASRPVGVKPPVFSRPPPVEESDA